MATSELDDIYSFIEIVLGLAAGGSARVDLGKVQGIQLDNLDGVVLSVTDEREPLEMATIEHTDGKRVCVWRCSTADWELAAEMLKALSRHGRAAYQYLPPDRPQDVEIEFDYLGQTEQVR